MATKQLDISNILAAILPRSTLQMLLTDYPEVGLDAVETHNFYFNSHLTSFRNITDNQRLAFTLMLIDCYPKVAERCMFQKVSNVADKYESLVSDFKGQTFAIPTVCCYHKYQDQRVQQRYHEMKYKALAESHDSGIY